MYEYIFLLSIIILSILILYYMREQIINYNIREKFIISPSKIHSFGVFSNEDIQINTNLFVAIDKSTKITKLGSMVNHSYKPNTNLVKTHEGWVLVSNKDILKGDEITANYNNTPNFIKKPDPLWK